MYGSDKYMLHNIKDKCSHYLQGSVDEERACVVLQTAHDFHLDVLRTNALKFILSIGEPCLESKGFLSLSPECLRLVIESDHLKCKEEIIYQKIIDWSTKRCQDQNLTVNDENIRQVLGDLLYLVRFPIMERNYFTANVSKKNLLTLDEIVKVYQSLDDEEIDVFPTKWRNKEHMEHMVCLRCDTSNSVYWCHTGNNDCLDFTTNLDCTMLGINVFGSNTYSGKHDINLTILNSSDVLRSIETVLYSEEGQKIYPVMFGKPLHVKKDTRYTIQLNMKGPEAFIGKSYKAIVSLNKLSITFLNSSLPSPNMTNGMGGQIPGIIIQHICKK
jgi:BTB/POZ domain-containing protein 1/2